MKLSDELTWRGFVNQMTFKDITELDGGPLTFYWGVDPSADSMQVGNLAAAMMVKCLIKHGHKPVLLVGGATGLVGDPDGKADERNLKTTEEIEHNKQAIAAQYSQIFAGYDFKLVDNYDWFKDMHYLQFLRDIGKHVPMRQMLGREFVQSRLGETGSGISYAEFSYVLIQAYDFLHLNKNYGVNLQVCGADQWGNSIAGVDLIRRVNGREAHVYSTPLIINKATGRKFGKSEQGTIWLDPKKTTPTQFYQFWINADDEGVEDYLKVFSELDQPALEELMQQHYADRPQRLAQKRLAQEVTTLVHGKAQTEIAQRVTEYLTGEQPIANLSPADIEALRPEIAYLRVADGASITDTLVQVDLAASSSEARRLLAGNAISINGRRLNEDALSASDFQNGYALIRKGKKFRDSALLELV